jgi:NAD(P)-dependent dehydrogenase (short-subunit alcohol dehydrogenase family)
MTSALDGRTIIVTGGSGLIGSRFCAAIADAGGTAVIADLDLDRAKRVHDELLRSRPHRSILVERCDITDARSLDRLSEAVLSARPSIDGLVNNAYPRTANYGRKVEDVDYDDFVANVGMHAGGYFLTTQRLLPVLRAAPDGGSIVNMSSIYGVVSPRFDIYDDTPMTMPVEYAAIKSAVLHLTRYFAQYLKRDGVRVNAISPGGIEDRQPEAFIAAYNAFGGAKGMLHPEDLAGTLVYLLSDASRYVTGQNIVVDDGWSL